jgi:hypothetical protein
VVSARPPHDSLDVVVGVVGDVPVTAGRDNVQQPLRFPLLTQHRVSVDTVCCWWEVGFDNIHHPLQVQNHLQHASLRSDRVGLRGEILHNGLPDGVMLRVVAVCIAVSLYFLFWCSGARFALLSEVAALVEVPDSGWSMVLPFLTQGILNRLNAIENTITLTKVGGSHLFWLCRLLHGKVSFFHFPVT